MLTELARPLLERWTFVMVKAGDAYVLPYTPQRLAQLHAQGGYGAAFPDFLARFMAGLVERGLPPGTYYPGGWYRATEAATGAPPRLEGAWPEALGVYHHDEITVDAAGAWRLGPKPIDPRISGYFLRNLHWDADVARYLIRYRLEAHFEMRYIHHLAPPFRVRRVTADGSGAVLWLNTGATEPLRPETLRMDAAEQLYCAVTADDLPAQFDDAARWELLKDADERDGRWVLSFAGRELSAALDAPWPYADRLPQGP